MPKLRLCDNSMLELEDLLDEDNKGVVDYFFKMDSSWAIAVLNQINNDKIYDDFFANKKYNTVLDLGAHIGMFSLSIHKSANQIFCVEPTPLHYHILKLLAKSFLHIKPYQFAISNRDGETDFFESTVNNTQNSIIQHGETSCIGKMPCLKIKTFLDQANIETIDFLKMDIEGCEMMVFDDPDLDWMGKRIKRIFLEIHNINNGPYRNSGENNRNILLGKLKKIGYNTFVIRDAIYAESI